MNIKAFAFFSYSSPHFDFDFDKIMIFFQDGAFYMNNEVKESVNVGIFDQISAESTEKKCREILTVCEK